MGLQICNKSYCKEKMQPFNLKSYLSQMFAHCLNICLTDHVHRARGQIQQHIATALQSNKTSPMGYIFWGSDECITFASFLTFYLKSCCTSCNHIEVLIFCINTYLGIYSSTYCSGTRHS